MKQRKKKKNVHSTSTTVRTATRIAPPNNFTQAFFREYTSLSLLLWILQNRGEAGTQQHVSIGSNKWLEGPTVSNTTTIFKTCGQQTCASTNTRQDQLVALLTSPFHKAKSAGDTSSARKLPPGRITRHHRSCTTHHSGANFRPSRDRKQKLRLF